MLAKNKQLKIALHGLDARFLKTIAAFLRGPCQNVATIEEGDDADLDGFDYDVISSKKLFEQYLQDGLLRPAVVMSVHNYSHEGVIYLKKPVTVDGMAEALKQAKKLAEKVSKITVEYGITKIPQVSVPAGNPLLGGDSASGGNRPAESDELQQISDWFDKALA